MTITPWKAKADRLIAEMSSTSYRAANTPKRAKHVPYTIPLLAAKLVECLQADDEIRAKQIFTALHNTPELARD